MSAARWLVVALIVALPCAILNAEAQLGARVYRVGLLSPESPPPGLLDEFREELRKLGYVEGRNLALEI
jgi:hypothetical protein